MPLDHDENDYNKDYDTMMADNFTIWIILLSPFYKLKKKNTEAQLLNNTKSHSVPWHSLNDVWAISGFINE